MNNKFLALSLVAVAVLAGAWVGRDSPVVRSVTRPLGLVSPDSTPDTAKTLAASGVHKCRTGAGVVYSDQPCPKGSHELAANGGTVTVMAFPKPVRAPAEVASGLLGSPLVKGLNKDEIDKLRDQQIESAANR